MTANPAAVLLDRREVAARLHRSEKWVDQARNATDPTGSPMPMPGWINIGSDSKPAYRLPESALIAWIAAQRQA